MAHTRKTMCDDFFPDSDYSEQIRELADLCDNLVPGLRPGGPRRPLMPSNTPGTAAAKANSSGCVDPSGATVCRSTI
jgi:hypothetical protein